MFFGIKEKSIMFYTYDVCIVGYCYKYTRATYDWFCGPGRIFKNNVRHCLGFHWNNYKLLMSLLILILINL